MSHKTHFVLVFPLAALGLIAMMGCRGDQQGAARGFSGDALQPEPHGSNTHPGWSPDGASIAFISNRDGVREGREINFEVYRAEADGSGERRLTRNQDFDADLAWSPDGTTILFKSYQDQNDEIYLVDASGGNLRNLTNSEASDGGGTWSPDGSTIVFHSDRGSEGQSRFYLMDVDGSNVRALPTDPGLGHSANWSPDGRQITFVSSRDGNAEIYVMDADGSNVRRITNDPRENGYPRWSPDGLTIAHTVGSFETDRWAVVLSDADGSNVREIVHDTDSGNVAWSPDGRRLIFGRYSRYGDGGGEESQLFITDLQTREEARLLVATP
jgi:TolB protein